MGDFIFNSSNYFFNPYAIAYAIVGVIIFFEGIFIFFQNKRSPTNLAYLINCFFPAVWLTGVGLTLVSQHKELALLWSRFYCFFGIAFIPAAVYLFSVIWEGSLIGDLTSKDNLRIYTLFSKRKSLIFIFLVSTIFYLFAIFSERFLTGIYTYPWGFYPRGELFLSIFMVWFFLVYILALRNFFSAYKKAPSLLKKRRARLIAMAFFIAAAGAIDFLPKYGVPLYLVGAVPVLFFVCLVGYCVARYKLVDIEVVLRKAVIWFLAGLILVVSFISILYLSYFWFSDSNKTGILFLLGFLGLIFLFFGRIFRSSIDLFFRRKCYDLEEIANQFTEDLVHLKGINSLSQRIKDVLKKTLHSQQVNLFIYDSGMDKFILIDGPGQEKLDLKIESTFLQWLSESNRIIYKSSIEEDPFCLSVKDDLRNYFNSTKSVVIVPLVLGKELIGLINLGSKETFKRYSALDFHFLTIIKNQSVIAISNSLLYSNMEDQVKKRTEELIEIQKQLIRAEKMATVGTLAGGVAHEINNPLTAILTNVQLLLSSDGSIDQESLQLIEEATKRCRTIVQKLMLYARKPSESEKMKRVDFRVALKNVINFIGYQFEQENIKIEAKIEPDDCIVLGNQDEIEQVITNFVLNAKDAIKKAKPRGTIKIFIFAEGKNIIIEFRDEGIGIPQENLSKIFDPFFTTKELGKGTGLGLSICQSIIQKHKGSIKVNSEPKKGSTFTLVLPLAEKAQQKQRDKENRELVRKSE